MLSLAYEWLACYDGLNDFKIHPSKLTPWYILSPDYKVEAEDSSEQHCVEHYTEVMKEIDTAIDYFGRLNNLNCSDIAARNKFFEENEQPEFVSNDCGSLRCVNQMGPNDPRWFVNWMLMNKGYLKPNELTIPREYDDYSSKVLMPLDTFLAWEPLFKVHQVKAEFFAEKFWVVDKENPSCLFSDEECPRTTGGDARGCFDARELESFRQEKTLIEVIQGFKDWGYDRESAWEFFDPKIGFFSRIFQPSEYSETPSWEDSHSWENRYSVSVELENKIFREQYVPTVFNSIFEEEKKKSLRKKLKK